MLHFIRFRWSQYVFGGKKHFAFLSTYANGQTNESIYNVLEDIPSLKSKYGFHTEYFRRLQKEKVIVEFSSPNIAKKFHVGHFRSTLIGNTLSNILSAAGHDVFKMNYLGDWGIQFALLAIGVKLYGNVDDLYKNPLSYLYNIYVKVSQESESNPEIRQQAQNLFLQMENGEMLEFWKLARSLSIKEFKVFYKDIGISFDSYSGESLYVEQAKNIISKQLDILDKNKDGTISLNLSQSSWLKEAPSYETNAILARSNGTTLYLTRDIAAAIDRYENLKFDKMIYVTDLAQEVHFKQLFASLEVLGHNWAKQSANKIQHIMFGRVVNMKTRAGKVMFLQDVFNTAIKLVKEEREKHNTTKRDVEDENHVIKTLALTGLVCRDLRGSMSKGYKFSWDAIVASKGNCGIFLQYTHCRLCSIEKNCGVPISYSIDPDLLFDTPSIQPLLEHLSKYTDITKNTYERLEPFILLDYLYTLGHLVGTTIRECPVKGQAVKLAQARLLCFHCTKIVFHNGLTLLGIEPLKKM